MLNATEYIKDAADYLSGAIGRIEHSVLYSEADRLASNDASALLQSALVAVAPMSIDDADFQSEVELLGLLRATFGRTYLSSFEVR